MLSLQRVHLADGCKLLLCFVLVLVLLVLGPLSFTLEGPLGWYVLRQSLSSRVKILAGTSGHYSNKNNRNLIRSQKICVLFTALVVTKCGMGVWVFFFLLSFI